MSSWGRFVPVAALLAVTTFGLMARGSGEKLPRYEELSTFPKQIQNWQGTDIPLDASTLEILGPGSFLSRDYQRSPLEAPVNLFIAFFPSQRTGDTIHSPKHCLPGAGWAPTESGYIELARPDGSRSLVNRYWIAKGMNRQIVLYWYQAHDRITPSEYWAKIFLVTDAIRLNRTDGALVRVITPILNNEANGVAETRAIRFAEGLLPLLDGYIPR